MSRVLSMFLSEERKKELGFLYAVLSILENNNNIKISEVIGKALEITNRVILERYYNIIKDKKKEIAKVMEEKFDIKEGEKVVEEFLERRLTK